MEITDKELIINIHHIGGIDECGPIDSISYLGDDIFWTFYDADADSLKNTSIKNKKYKLINKCIGGKDGKEKFNVLVNPSASSVLLPAKSATNYVMPNGIEWGKHTQLKETVDIKMHKLDTLIKQKEIGQIDFLSVDAQGLDYEIIEGLDKNISSTIGVLCEVEFAPLYEGQKLFSDIDIKLRGKGFRLSTLYNPQIFNHMCYSKVQRGRGFLTVSEILWLKNIDPLFDKLKQDIPDEEKKKIVIQLIKLAGASIFFEHFDFSYDIVNRLERMKLISIDEFATNSNLTYVHMLKQLNDGTFKIKFKRWNE